MSVSLTGQHNLIYPFWGIDGDYRNWFPKNELYLVSAASLWSNKRKKFIKRSYPLPRNRMFLDCGGYSFFSKYSKYPFTPEEYFKLVSHNYYGYGPLVWASMDYPCEGTVNRGNLLSNGDRIMATVDYLKYFTRKDFSGLLPVIQGYTIPERLFCFEKILQFGLQKPYMAIGSLCACNSVKMIDDIILNLGRFAVASIPNFRGFHLFGVKLDWLSYAKESKQYVFSIDTSAWRYFGAKSGKIFPSRQEEECRFFGYRERFNLLAGTN